MKKVDQVREVGQWNQLSMANTMINKYAKNCPNRRDVVEVIIEDVQVW